VLAQSAVDAAFAGFTGVCVAQVMAPFLQILPSIPDTKLFTLRLIMGAQLSTIWLLMLHD